MKEKKESTVEENIIHNENGYHYDAFISYRHSDLDKFVAENIHKQLEAYRMPKSVIQRRKGQKNQIERVFRDKEELPLTSNLNDPIMAALNNSDWLIVICSPRLRESLWCKKEIETFVKLHGRERILAVLIEGEPSESFPDELLFRTETITHPDGSIEEVKIPVEPLAADIRGKNKGEMIKAMKTEVLRILAAMFQLNFDDLRQRHREQQHKRKMAIVWSVAIVSILFALFCTGVAIKLNEKNLAIQELVDRILKQDEEIKYEQAVAYADVALRTLESGDREGAIQIAFEALTQKEYITMPYTPEAQYALAASLRAYDSGDVYRAQYQYEAMGIIRNMKLSPDGKFLAMLDETDTFTVLCVETKEVILELGKEEQNTCLGEDTYGFLADSRIVYINKNDEIIVYDLVNKKQNSIRLVAARLYTDKEGMYLLAEDMNKDYYFYNGSTLDYMGMIPDFENVFGMEYASVSETGMLACSYRVQGTTDSVLYCINGENMETCFTTVFENSDVKDVVIDGNTLYVLVGCEGSERGDVNTYVYAFDVQTGQLLWEDEQNGCYAGFLRLDAEKDSLFVATDRNMSIYDTNDGALSYRQFVEAKPLYAKGMSGCYDVFLENGSYIWADIKLSDYLDMSSLFQCGSDNIMQYCFYENTIIVLNEHDYRITVYTLEKAPAVVPVSDSVNKMEPIYYKGDEAVRLAKEYGLENYAGVNTLFFDEEKSWLFASCWNKDFIVYDTYGEYVINTIEDCDTMIGYLGKDLNGNLYIKSEDCGYMLTQDGHFVMSIPGMVALNAEQNKVYIETDGTIYEAPIYSIFELLQMAAPYMDTASDINMSAYEDISSET